MSSWRTSRQRLAPSAALIVTSRDRSAPRASSRLARLAQPISSTAPTARHQHQQRQPQLRPDDPIDPAVDRRAPVFLDRRILLRDAARDLRHLGLRLLQAHAGLEPRDGVQVVEVPHGVGRERQRHPRIGQAPVEFTRRQHADHGMAFAVEDDVPADHAGIAAEL